MEILMRVLVRILDWMYGPRSSIPGSGVDPVTDALFRKYVEDARNQNLQVIADRFSSDSVPVGGAVDYSELNWDTFSKATETADNFTFYSGPNLAKVIEKRHFTNRQELLTLRRMIQRHVAACELLSD